MIHAVISSDGARVKFTRILNDAKNPRAVMAAVGRQGANDLRAHFRRKDQTEANKLGGRREHFWRQVMQSVSAPTVSSSGRTVTITITDPRFPQKVFGGTIRAKRAKALTIPVTPEAYGRAASVFEHETGVKLFVIASEFGEGLLAAQIGGVVKVEYLLRKSVDQAPDPDALPPRELLERNALERAQSVVDRQNAQGGTSQ